MKIESKTCEACNGLGVHEEMTFYAKPLMKLV